MGFMPSRVQRDAASEEPSETRQKIPMQLKWRSKRLTRVQKDAVGRLRRHRGADRSHELGVEPCDRRKLGRGAVRKAGETVGP